MSELPTPEDDGLLVDEVGAWSKHKHHFLFRYMDAFVTAMRKKRWASLHYIDLFAGPGILRISDESRELIWGSPLLAAHAPRKFSRLHLCEKNERRFKALEQRIRRFPQPSPPQLLCGDANKAVGAIVREVPERALALCFLDPFSLTLQYSTVVELSKRNVDFVIFFPDHLDALRNWKIYRDKPNSNLDGFLGTDAWREKLADAAQEKWPEVLRRIYEGQLRKLGYEHFAYERISMKGHPLYLLVFCSRHERGKEIWNKTSQTKPGGQRSFGW